MEYENGNRDMKKYKSKKYEDESSENESDNERSHYKSKQKYKDREREHRPKDKKERKYYKKSYRDKDYDKSHRERDRDVEKSFKDKSYKHKDYRDKEKKRHNRNHSASPSAKHHRSRSSSRSRSRSRSPRSTSRHRARHSPPPFRRKSAYDEKRYEMSFGGRAKDLPESFAHNKGQRKMMILEKLGIDLVVPEHMDKPQPGAMLTAPTAGQKGITGELAAYCNLTPANSRQIMERLNRKKLLWQNKANEPKPTNDVVDVGGSGSSATGNPNAMWQTAVFTKDNDNKQAAKFKRLMGIKAEESGAAGESAQPTSGVSDNKDLLKRQEEMFQNMEMQYEVARASTHTHRGIGLGFGIHQYPR